MTEIEKAINVLRDCEDSAKGTPFEKAYRMGADALLAQQERERGVPYRFLGEGTFQQDDEHEASSVCVVQCRKCGWKQFGDAWWEAEDANFVKSEQIPQYCNHCGAKLDEEASE